MWQDFNVPHLIISYHHNKQWKPILPKKITSKNFHNAHVKFL